VGQALEGVGHERGGGRTEGEVGGESNEETEGGRGKEPEGEGVMEGEGRQYRRWQEAVSEKVIKENGWQRGRLSRKQRGVLQRALSLAVYERSKEELEQLSKQHQRRPVGPDGEGEEGGEVGDQRVMYDEHNLMGVEVVQGLGGAHREKRNGSLRVLGGNLNGLQSGAEGDMMWQSMSSWEVDCMMGIDTGVWCEGKDGRAAGPAAKSERTVRYRASSLGGGGGDGGGVCSRHAQDSWGSQGGLLHTHA
jgi:hypothetical protein